MAELFAVAALAGAAVYKLVDFIRAFDRTDQAPSWVWIGVALTLGVGAMFFLQIDVSSVPSGAPEWVVRLVAGLIAGGIASGYHEGADALSSSAAKNREVAEGGGA